MKNLDINKLVELKNGVINGTLSQKVEFENATSNIVEDYYARSCKLQMAKDYIESHIKGILVSVSGGGIKQHNDETDYTEYNPIKITSRKVNDKNNYSVITLDGYLLEEANYTSLIYDNYISYLVEGNEHIEKGFTSNWDIVIGDLLDETYLCECGFTTSNNQVVLFKDDKMYTIVNDIGKEVQGVIQVNLPNEIDPSIIIICYDKNILISDEWFYIDSMEETK